MSGMEADDLDDSLCGGAKCDRENSDCAQLESRNRDKTKVTVNVMSYYVCKSDSVNVKLFVGQGMWTFELPGWSKFYMIFFYFGKVLSSNKFQFISRLSCINFCNEILQVPPLFWYCSQSSHTRVKVMTLVTLGWGQVFWRKFWHRKNWFV